MKASDWLLTCVRQLDTPNVEADPGQSRELLSLEHRAGPVLGRHHLKEYYDVIFTITMLQPYEGLYKRSFDTPILSTS